MIVDSGGAAATRRRRRADDPPNRDDADDNGRDDEERHDVAEEIGKEASSWEELLSFNTSPGFSDERVWVYLATGLRDAPGGAQADADEHIEIVPWPLDRLFRLLGRHSRLVTWEQIDSFDPAHIRLKVPHESLQRLPMHQPERRGRNADTPGGGR